MSLSTRDWLPDTALVEPELIDRLDAAVGEWSAKWFGDRAVQRVRAEMSHTASAGSSWRRCAAGIWVDLPWQTGLALARHALALGAALPKASAADERLLAHYAEKIAGELALQIAGTLRARSEAGVDEAGDLPPPQPGLELKLCATANELNLCMFLEASALVALRKRLCRPWRAPEAADQPLSRALAQSPVAFEASLGIARMSALDLKNIAPGDIVVLERATSDPVLLRASESGTVVAGVRLLREGGELQLKAC